MTILRNLYQLSVVLITMTLLAWPLWFSPVVIAIVNAGR